MDRDTITLILRRIDTLRPVDPPPPPCPSCLSFSFCYLELCVLIGNGETPKLPRLSGGVTTIFGSPSFEKPSYQISELTCSHCHSLVLIAPLIEKMDNQQQPIAELPHQSHHPANPFSVSLSNSQSKSRHQITKQGPKIRRRLTVRRRVHFFLKAMLVSLAKNKSSSAYASRREER